MSASKLLISFVISLYSSNTLFIETSSSWVIFELIKALEIMTSTLFNLAFANNTILSCFFFLIIDLYFLIHAVIAKKFNSITELVISTKIPTKEAKTEIRHMSSNCNN